MGDGLTSRFILLFLSLRAQTRLTPRLGGGRSNAYLSGSGSSSHGMRTETAWS